jgi:recombination protein RecR
MRSILPRAVRELAAELSRLPGIGPKSAQRLALHLLRQPYPVVAKLSDTIKDLHANVRICTSCFNLSETEQCLICQDRTRDGSVICLVEDALDVEAIERTDTFQGLYHVLGGVLSPMEGISADQLTINELFIRLQRGVKELIIALDHKMEAEATAHYITDHLHGSDITITRLARGLPTGGDIEFADALTLSAAFSGRRKL